MWNSGNPRVGVREEFEMGSHGVLFMIKVWTRMARQRNNVFPSLHALRYHVWK